VPIFLMGQDSPLTTTGSGHSSRLATRRASGRIFSAPISHMREATGQWAGVRNNSPPLAAGNLPTWRADREGKAKLSGLASDWISENRGFSAYAACGKRAFGFSAGEVREAGSDNMQVAF